MRHKLWLVLLAAAVGYTAYPLARYAKRGWVQLNASRQWAEHRLLPTPLSPGEPCGWLHIPKAEISQLILWGAEKQRLVKAPCLEVVGQSTLIMAHRDSHFRQLHAVQPGVAIRLEQRPGMVQTYRCMDAVVIDKEEAAAFIERHRAKDRLLLLTCYPFQYIGPAPSRYVVVAKKDV